jgi:bifunctional DNA-binding transcriptional regulator/antitoxin component of YhaV-PrlF toxin-antitoxin module
VDCMVRGGSSPLGRNLKSPVCTGLFLVRMQPRRPSSAVGTHELFGTTVATGRSDGRSCERARVDCTVVASLYDIVKAVPRISSKHQVTLPVETLASAGLKAGDEVSIEADGPDTIVVRRATHDVDSALGVFDGLFEPGYLEQLRREERA